MPTPSATPVESFQQAKEKLEVLAAAHKNSSFDLPALKTENSKLAELLQRFFDWLGEKLSFHSNFNTETLKTISKFLPYLFWGLGIVLASAIILWVADLVRKKFFSPKIENFSIQHFSPDELENLLKTSIEMSQWDLAMRISWMVFLKRNGMQSSVTPFEYSSETSKFNRNEISELYRLMFQPSFGSREKFMPWKERLHDSQV